MEIGESVSVRKIMLLFWTTLVLPDVFLGQISLAAPERKAAHRKQK